MHIISDSPSPSTRKQFRIRSRYITLLNYSLKPTKHNAEFLPTIRRFFDIETTRGGTSYLLRGNALVEDDAKPSDLTRQNSINGTSWPERIIKIEQWGYQGENRGERTLPIQMLHTVAHYHNYCHNRLKISSMFPKSRLRSVPPGPHIPVYENTMASASEAQESGTTWGGGVDWCGTDLYLFRSLVATYDLQAVPNRVVIYHKRANVLASRLFEHF